MPTNNYNNSYMDIIMQPQLEKLKKAVVNGNCKTIAMVARSIVPLWEEIMQLVVSQMASECCALSQKSSPTLVRNMPISEMMKFSWERLMREIGELAPTLQQILLQFTSTETS